MVDAAALAEWLGRLVRIPSVSPDHGGPRAGETGESRMGAAVEQWFRAFGGEVHTDEVLPGRRNVYGIWRGDSRTWAALDVHMDTVGVEEMTGDPFSGEIRGGRVHGRGAVDTKASLAVALALLEAMAAAGARPWLNLLVAATVDEESGARGAPALARWVREQGIELDQIAVAEPTGCGPVVGHKGAVRLEIRVEGEPAHSSQPHLGKNAIIAAARLALALEDEHRRLQLERPTVVGSATLTVTRISGGTGTNVVPPEAALTLDRRVVAGETPEAVRDHLLALVARHCLLPHAVDVSLLIPSFSQPPETPWIRRLAEWSGRNPEVVPYGTNAWAYAGLAGECAVLGPGSIEQAHGREEWVEIAQLELLAGIYARWWGIGPADKI